MALHSLVYDGSSGYVNMPNVFDMDFGAGPRSFGIFVKIAAAPASPGTVLMFKYQGSGFAIFIKSSGPPNFYLNDGTNVVGMDAATNVCNNTWRHLGFSYDGAGVMHCYVDGTL